MNDAPASPPQDLAFPPLGNPGVWSLASAPVGADPAFRQLAHATTALPDGPCRELVAPYERWLSAAARTANDQRFRFEVTGLHAAGLDPVLASADALAATSYLGEPAVAAGRSTAKLVLFLCTSGEGAAQVSAAGLSAAADVEVGTLVVAPAFAALRLDAPEGTNLRFLAVSVEGPAFR